MRLRWRNKTTPPSDPHADQKEREVDHALRQAQSALSEVRKSKADGSLIANTLKQIRKDNHFQEMWNEGLRGG